ncbi:MAG: helix-turn-helix domain-containing protein, partial [Clostridia bacterium]|nr:helix-turn-helix domain-containing protein [Clostridia bacterium]
MEENMKDIDFGEKLKELRKRKNVSQEQLAFDLKVSRQTVYKWEANGMQPNMESIATLCRYFGVKSEYFFDDELTEEVAAAADNGGEAQAQVQTEVKGKGKDKRFIICLSLLVVCSVLFIVFAVLSFSFGMLAFSPNVGVDIVSDFDNTKIIFTLTLVGGIISLGAGIVLGFL